LFDKIKNERAKIWLKRIFHAMIIAYLIFLSSLTILRNRDWSDPITFYEKNLRYSPQSFIQHNNLGMAYDAAGRFDEAIAQYRQAIAIKDIYPQIHSNLANSLVNAKQYAEAEKEYRRAIAMDPGFILPYRNLYKLYLYEGKNDEAEKLLKNIK
jgi:Flp pilus assembly protein TadD